MGRALADDDRWRFERAVARVEAVVGAIVAEHATSYVGRAVQRRTVSPPRPLPGISWSIDGELVVEFVHRRDAPDQLFVHDVAVLREVRKRFRSKHVDVVHASTSWDGE